MSAFVPHLDTSSMMPPVMISRSPSDTACVCSSRVQLAAGWPAKSRSKHGLQQRLRCLSSGTSLRTQPAERSSNPRMAGAQVAGHPPCAEQGGAPALWPLSLLMQCARCVRQAGGTQAPEAVDAPCGWSEGGAPAL